MSFEEVTKAVLEKSRELDEHLQTIKKLNDELRDRSSKVLKALEKLVGSTKIGNKNCNVCYSRPRTHAVLQCGHGSFCENCATRCLERGRCYVCRATVTEMIRIYI